MSPEVLKEWTPARKREFRQRFPASWPRVKYQLDKAEMARRAGITERQNEIEARRRKLLCSFNAHRHREALLKSLLSRERAARGIRKPSPPGTAKRIAHLAAAHAGVSVEEMCGATRVKGVSEARMAAMFLTKQHCAHFSMTEIGRRFGGRDHSTVSNAISRVKDDLKAKGERFLSAIAFIESRMSTRSTDGSVNKVEHG